MPLNLTWQDVAIRLISTIAAGALIGFDRGEHGQNAGLRTTLLVMVAASLSMLDVNALLNMSGKTPESFAVMDLMRLPLGILSGMGFIGAGAILRKGSLVTGVTTAATLWFGTVLGLCFGGGQVALGWVGTALGLIVLWALRHYERKMKHEQSASLMVMIEGDGLLENDLRQKIISSHMNILSTSVTYFAEDKKNTD